MKPFYAFARCDFELQIGLMWESCGKKLWTRRIRSLPWAAVRWNGRQPSEAVVTFAWPAKTLTHSA